MEVLGRLSLGIAHDINNLLTVLASSLWLLEESLHPDATQRELLGTLSRTVEHAGTLTRQVLAFARQGEIRRTSLDLNAIVAQVVDILRTSIPPQIKLEIHPAGGLPAAWADATQVTQVLLNLCQNAQDAMPAGGCLRVETQVVDVGEEAHLFPQGRPGRFVRLRVKDTGEGIPREVQARMFEPFFSTKPPGQGTGLGLSIVAQIVAEHDGWITCQSEVGQGTCFDVYFPSGTKDPKDPKDQKDQGLRTTDKAPPSILVVESDPNIRRLAQKVLVGRGFATISASDVASALESCREKNETVARLVQSPVLPVRIR
jgi:signal transduction histidine kinase